MCLHAAPTCCKLVTRAGLRQTSNAQAPWSNPARKTEKRHNSLLRAKSMPSVAEGGDHHKLARSSSNLLGKLSDFWLQRKQKTPERHLAEDMQVDQYLEPSSISSFGCTSDSKILKGAAIGVQ